MCTSDVDTEPARYILFCGHVLEIPAEVVDTAIDDQAPRSPYCWCDACSRWRRIWDKVAPGSAASEGE